eukprot:2964077-Prymnesium_polylepis.1
MPGGGPGLPMPGGALMPGGGGGVVVLGATAPLGASASGLDSPVCSARFAVRAIELEWPSQMTRLSLSSSEAFPTTSPMATSWSPKMSVLRAAKLFKFLLMSSPPATLLSLRRSSSRSFCSFHLGSSSEMRMCSSISSSRTC